MTNRHKYLWSVTLSKSESNRLNNFAISSDGIGEALKRSASAMAAANNTLEESIALITAGNSVIQDPDTVGEFYCPAA